MRLFNFENCKKQQNGRETTNEQNWRTHNERFKRIWWLFKWPTPFSPRAQFTLIYAVFGEETSECRLASFSLSLSLSLARSLYLGRSTQPLAAHCGCCCCCCWNIVDAYKTKRDGKWFSFHLLCVIVTTTTIAAAVAVAATQAAPTISRHFVRVCVRWTLNSTARTHDTHTQTSKRAHCVGNIAAGVCERASVCVCACNEA